MRTLVPLIIAIGSILLMTGFKMGGHGENQPTVQSAPGGYAYVRSIPKNDYGNEGKTQVFRVRKNGDELLDEYSAYMRGELYLGASPITGKCCLVHLEPERITTNNDLKSWERYLAWHFTCAGKSLPLTPTRTWTKWA